MINIKPFKAVRPPRDKANLVASRPFYNYKKHILTAKLEGNPYTFLHVINPEFKADDRTKPNTRERFEKVKNKYDDFKLSNILQTEDTEAFYIYRQITPTNTYIGIIAGVAVENYINGQIKVHEHTLTEREKTFCKYIDVCKFNAEPVLLTYKDEPEINQIIDQYINTRSEYEFTTTDHIKHDLWIIAETAEIQKIQTIFNHIPKVYIADGHHRTASSALYATENKHLESAQYFLSYFIAESKLRIYDFNRAISGLNGLTKVDFLEEVNHYFTITETSNSPLKPTQLHEFTMYLDHQWYRLNTKSNFIDSNSPVGSLDPQILSDTILSKILGVTDLKNDTRAHFIEGTKGLTALEEIVNNNIADVSFALHPVSIDQLKLIADTNNIMPPKSTWIEPKLRSGLTIYEF
ncbi:MAG: DUF1015 domain-containing protein [Flavobacteriales bacterium]|jgi:uncharacterized protein (DUF1015 family)|nr:DUF1015 domain-containing protein [Flavobacteriales bacterium]